MYVSFALVRRLAEDHGAPIDEDLCMGLPLTTRLFGHRFASKSLEQTKRFME